MLSAVVVAEGADFAELTRYLVGTTRLGAGEAERVVADVLSYFCESTEAFVRRRHRELQQDGLANVEIYDRIAGELACRRVTAPVLTHRQLRRLVYG